MLDETCSLEMKQNFIFCSLKDETCSLVDETKFYILFIEDETKSFLFIVLL